MCKLEVPECFRELINFCQQFSSFVKYERVDFFTQSTFFAKRDWLVKEPLAT